jgi:DNA helicase IV
MAVVAADPQLAEEQEHLDRTFAAYDALLDALSVSRRNRQGDEFTEEVLERMRLERLRAYTGASGPLYFGRIDRPGEGPLYVGRHAVADEGNRLLAINWRAPAAEPFYAATPADPRGVSRRRRLDIEDRVVLGFVDEQLQTGEEHLTEAIVDDITRQRVGEMRQIISTITPEQYGLISLPPDGTLVVQGGPGTGKTAVGLHRAAWLLYADPQLAREGVLVVGPNRVFIAYISQVLPSLGEQSVDQRPIDALVSRRRWDGEDSDERATLLGSGRMAAALSRLLWDKVGPPAAPARIEVARVAVELEPDDVAEVIEEARTRLTYDAGRARFRDRLADRVATEVMRRSASAGQADPEAVLSAVRQTREYQKLASSSWPRTTPEALVAQLFKNRRRLTAVTGELLAPEEVDLLLATPPAKGTTTHGEFALLDEARALIDPELRRFGHVVVDEAQNLTPMELRMATRRARGQSLTILGDLAQRTAEAGVHAWDSVLAEAGVTRHSVRELEISYRVPDEFLTLAAPLVPSGSAVPRGVRSAPWPPLAVATGEPRLGDTTAEHAAELAREVGSVGVIAPTHLMAAMREALQPLGFADATVGPLGPAINLLDPHVAKGLEFDAALVVEPAAIYDERPDGGPGGLYTALTRSTRALVIVHARDLPAALAGAPALLRR